MQDTIDTRQHPRTFVDAERVNVYELAERWSASTSADALEELATMTALRTWLTRWMPSQLHTALLTGSTVAEVSAAANLTVDAMALAWRQWADVQRELVIGDHTAVSRADYDRVAAILGGGE